MVFGQGRGVDEPIDWMIFVNLAEKIAVLGADRKSNALLTKFIGNSTFLLIGAENSVAGVVSHFGERTDAGAGNPRKINIHVYIIYYFCVSRR